jgi:hypothetical protein
VPGVEDLAGIERLEGVGSAYAATRDGIDTLLRDRGLRQTSPELTTESLLRGAHATAVLEGSASSLDDVREGDGDDIAQGALRVSVELARLHTLAAGAAVPADERGRPRDPASATRLRESLAVLGSDRPALMTAALLHAELRCGAPFSGANGIVARAAERLVLVSSGVDTKALVVPEAGHLALRPAYESNLRAYAEGGRPGLRAWLLYCAEAYAAGAEASPLRDR